MTSDASSGEAHPEPGDFRLSSAVFARREGRILILKRAAGELTGAWYSPGGAVDVGETPEEAAIRELHEEAGIAPTGPLHLIAAVPMHVYGRDSVQLVYACDAEEGEVQLSHEHSGARWIDPREYRDRYFSAEQIARVADASPRAETMVRGVRDALDRYITWLDERAVLAERRRA